jgi:hypothetical protein
MHRRKRRKQASGDWGVVMIAVGAEHGPPVWCVCWMELRFPYRASIEIDEDPEQNITPAAWGRARRAFGLPVRILVLDDATAERVRKVVPPRVAVVVKEHPRLRAMLVDHAVDEDDRDPWAPPRPRDRARA